MQSRGPPTQNSNPNNPLESTQGEFIIPSDQIIKKVGEIHPDYPEDYIRENHKDLRSIHKFVKKQFFRVKNPRFQLFIFFLFMTVFVFKIEFTDEPNNELIADIRKAIVVTNIWLVYVGCLILPKPSANWPSTRIWRLINACAFAYLINIIFLSFFNKENLIYVLSTVFDPSLKQYQREDDYASDCRVFTPENPESYFFNIINSFDIYIMSHFIGWIVRAFIFRNQPMLWIFGVGFELMERTFYHWLPNFNECWWDSLIFDLFGCNFLGILIGSWIVNYNEMNKYHWFMEPDQKMMKMTFFGKCKYFITGRKQYQKEGKWHILASPKNYLYVASYITQNYLFDLSHFFNKYNLHIVTTSYLLIGRVCILGLFFISLCGDYFKFIAIRKGYGMNIPIFIAHLIILVETMIYWKYQDFSEYQGSIPIQIKINWMIFGGVFLGILVWLVVEQFVTCYIKKPINGGEKLEGEKKLN